MQQQQLQKQLLTQTLLMQQQALTGGVLVSTKKQREVYVGNLTIGVVTDVMLRELFNGALSHLVPDPITNPPVVNAQLDPSGRFGFVEMRTEELATSAMALDKVDLCNRQINVGRPKGYVEPPGGHAPPATLASAQIFAAQLAKAPSRILLLKNMLKAQALLDDQERVDLLEDVQEECGKYGTVEGIAVPKPPPDVGEDEMGRVYVKFASSEEVQAAKDIFHNRQFDGFNIEASFAPEEDYERACDGQWIKDEPKEPPMPALPPPPGLTQSGPLPPGLSGIAALNPMLSNVMVTNPALVGLMSGNINAAEVPNEEGWVKLRGIPFNISKAEIIRFFEGCGTIREEQVKIVMGMDGRPSGEAYVEVAGPDAKFRLALSKDRQIMPNSSRYVEIFTSNREEVERRMMTGVALI
eukprot:jgi/Botrbrau1/7645/Bobra.0159s0089.4